jgi:hypothetical protein
MRELAIPMGIDYIFQKKEQLFFIFYQFFLSKKKKKTPTPLYCGWSTIYWGGRPATYGAGGGETTPRAFGVAQATPSSLVGGRPLVFKLLFYFLI